MSVYYVTIRGKQYTVEVPDVRARPVRAIVDGEVVEVDVAPALPILQGREDHHLLRIVDDGELLEPRVG